MSKFDILKPELVWLGDRCYRKMPIKTSVYNPEEDDLYPSEAKFNYGDDDFCDVPFKHSKDGFWVSMNPPEELMKILNKRQLIRIEKDTKTKIDMSSKTLQITIKGSTKKNVADAYRRIAILFESARARLPFTYFVSIPMNFDALRDSFIKFKSNVLKNCSGSRGLNDSIFQDPEKLHFTIVLLVLLDKQERETAAAVLQSCKETLRDLMRDRPLTVTVKGIEYMNDDPAEVDVLYAKINEEDSNYLQIIADQILTKYEETNLIAKQQQKPIKLHMTLMNTTFRDKTNEGNFKNERETFDATKILERYSDFDFSVVTISEIHLSVRYTTANDGYYRSASILKL